MRPDDEAKDMADKQVNRRGFMKKTVLASAGTAAALSLEEKTLLAAVEKKSAKSARGRSPGAMPMGKIGKLRARAEIT